MVQVLILSHGALAHALVDTAERIVGRLEDVQALSLDWDGPREDLLARLHQVVDSIDEGDGVLILTDLFGDTPSNLALGLVEPGRVEVVTGVNLPMVLRLACVPREGNQGSRPATVPELAGWIQAKGRQGICLGAAREPALVGGRS
ncbi:MAG TPA: PTS sugar transporter subunit IIA [Thermoanaerobaculia bacterium]|nr:PTS sugar transporter subunit IIA [Thermoanaerobaculia bacterium]HXT49858.1 PTS sugar transporter subunit IIA [Thermoanaerobaculia bacterium]